MHNNAPFITTTYHIQLNILHTPLSRALPPLPWGQEESRMQDSCRQQRRNHGDAIQRVLVHLYVSVSWIECFYRVAHRG